MRKYYSIPLLFFAFAAALGLFLRWQFIDPTPGVRYTWFLHSHSHIMFLGWVFNLLYLSFVDHHVSLSQQPLFTKLFVLLQTLVIAMMISFPLQGYGTWSIIFSTLHTFGALIFVIMFFRRTSGEKTVPIWFARMALLFFCLSTAGPFSLGYLMSNGMGQTVWYHLSIYYYLHFQYNGFFLFGMFSLFFQLLEIKSIPFDSSKAMSFGRWLAIACVPAYALSVLFANPPNFFHIIGAAAAIMQIFAVYKFSTMLTPILHQMKGSIQQTSYSLLKVILIALVMKLFLQLSSAHPHIAQLAYELRPVVIAYLHLVLVGVISLSIIVWYLERNLLRPDVARSSLIILLAGFIGSEICLVLIPWWGRLPGNGPSASTVIFAFSVLMFAGTLLLYRAFFLGVTGGQHKRHSKSVLAKTDKNQDYI